VRQYALDAVIVLAAMSGGVLLGHPVVSGVFAQVARSARGPRTGAQAAADPPAAHVADPPPLAGGRWIGYLERVSVIAALLVGWPEGIALAVAIKGLGRYQELRSATPGTAERFIIGTFTSLLWACAWGLVGRWGLSFVR
jgi:hypothetical protein